MDRLCERAVLGGEEKKLKIEKALGGISNVSAP